MKRHALPPITPRPSRSPKQFGIDLKTLADAANESAKREATQWFFFVTIMLTLAAIIGSTTHRVLFLEEPVKVPILSVELPLQGFYIAAPAIFVVMHFYLLAQVRLMSEKVRAYLTRAEAEAGGRNAVFLAELNRLDGFSVAQLIVADRLARPAPAVRAMAWVTLVVAPVVVLLAFQIRFLPFHSGPITWWHRGLLGLDLALVWMLWPPLESQGRIRATIQGIRAAGVMVVMGFACLIATIPDEAVDQIGGQLRVKIGLFDGEVDTVTQRPRSLFSRVLILPDEDFVPESEAQIATLRRTRVLRGRDLRYAVLDRTDLRKADLAGARLTGARLRDARLDHAWLFGADLRGASLDGASLIFTALPGARLHGASLTRARLDGAILGSSRFGETEDHSFRGARLVGASLMDASLRGADLRAVDLRGALLLGAQLQGAQLSEADLRGSALGGACLWRSDATGAVLQSLDGMRRPGGTVRCRNPFDPMSQSQQAEAIDSLPTAVHDIVRGSAWARPESAADGQDERFRATWRRQSSAEPGAPAVEVLLRLVCEPGESLRPDDRPFVASGVLRQLGPRQIMGGEGALESALGGPVPCPGAAGLAAVEARRPRLVPRIN